jgi:hypothetical protein
MVKVHFFRASRHRNQINTNTPTTNTYYRRRPTTADQLRPTNTAPNATIATTERSRVQSKTKMLMMIDE